MERLAELGLGLPEAGTPEGVAPRAERVGRLLYTTGVMPLRDGALLHPGVVGAEIGLAEATEAAAACAHAILALVVSEAGSLDAVDQVVQITGLVRSAPDFVQQARVLNAASEVIYRALGERGRHTRMALATSDLAHGSCLEVSAIVRLRAAA